MTEELLKIIEEKTKALDDLKGRFDSLMTRLEKREGGANIVLPEFEAYGWSRLGEFLNRLDEAINSPLLENARALLDEIGIIPQSFDKLKSALSVRREGLIEILRETTKEFKRIQNGKLQDKVRRDLAKYLDDGKWDELVERVRSWKLLEDNLGSLLKVMNNDTHLYNALFEKVLEEGPLTDLISKLEEIEKKASHIGGEILRDQVKFEVVKTQINPLDGVEEDLDKIAKKKEELRQLKGDEVDMDKIVQKSKPLSATIDKLIEEYGVVKHLFDAQHQTVEKLLQRYNNLATILKRNTKIMPSEISFKQLKEFGETLEGDIKKLENELERTLTEDARRFIESLLEGKLPEGWDEKRIVAALEELLNKRILFQVKLKE